MDTLCALHQNPWLSTESLTTRIPANVMTKPDGGRRSAAPLGLQLEYTTKDIPGIRRMIIDF